MSLKTISVITLGYPEDNLLENGFLNEKKHNWIKIKSKQVFKLKWWINNSAVYGVLPTANANNNF